MVIEYFDVTYKSSKTNNLIDMHKYCKNKNKSVKKGVVIGTKKFIDSIESYVNEQIKNNECKLFNWFIDADGVIYKILPSELSGLVCKFNLYSHKAAVNFQAYCPLLDGEMFPRNYSPDETLDSIIVQDCGYGIKMCQEKALCSLCGMLLNGLNMNENDVYMTSMFPYNKNIEKPLYTSTVQFMIFKKKLSTMIKECECVPKPLEFKLKD